MLTNDEPEEDDYATHTLRYESELASNRFHDQETMTAYRELDFDGKYLLTIEITEIGKTSGMQVRIDSDTFDIHDQWVPASPNREICYWKLMDLTAGEYTLTAESTGEGECTMTAHITMVKELDSFPDSLAGDRTYVYLCPVPEDMTIDYTYQYFGDIKINGPVTRFYSLDHNGWQESIRVEKNKNESTGSIDIPAGDLIIRSLNSKWSLEFE